LGSRFAPFRGPRGTDWVLVLIFGALHLLVLGNALLHDPEVGYDAHQHLKYAQTLAEGRLPARGDSAEFFSPPLPYVLPALAMRALGLDLRGAGKAGQLVNVLLSLGIVLLMLLLCDEVAPGSEALKRGALLLLALETVYYKTLSFVRGEAYVAFFSLLAILLALRAARDGGRKAALGGVVALLLLSRQWGLLVMAGLLLFAVLRSLATRDARPLRTIGASAVIGVALAAPFYLHLRADAGGALAFNRSGAASFSFANEPGSFYFGLGDGQLFTEPLRPNFPNELVPILYSETWGDYWEFFVVYAKEGGVFLSGRDLERSASGRLGGVETNRRRMAAFLGRVNALSLLPTAVLLAGLALGLRAALRPASEGAAARAALALVVLASAVGYLAFLVRYPETERGDTIKATYLLHAFPLLSILGAEAVRRLERGRAALVVLWALVFIHDLPAFVTRHF
jgi:hypothetical protein